MVDVRVDHTLIEQALATLSRHVYIDDLRMSQRAPIVELQRLVRAATVERTVTDVLVMVCSGCGYRTDACPECAGTDFQNPTAVDPAAMAEAMSRPIAFEVEDCDSPEGQPDSRCRCNRCLDGRAAQETARVNRISERMRQREMVPSCRECGRNVASHEALAIHITRHTSYCGLCGWWNPDGGTSEAPQGMAEHWQDSHEQCNDCNRYFQDRTTWENHRTAMHGARPIGLEDLLRPAVPVEVEEVIDDEEDGGGDSPRFYANYYVPGRPTVSS